MSPLPWWVKTAMLAAVAAGAYWWGSSNAGTKCALASASRDIEIYGVQAAMQARLGAADRALAESQLVVMRGVAVEVTRKEVIYRDRIKDRVVYQCVADSGLLELIDASNGVGGPKR